MPFIRPMISASSFCLAFQRRISSDLDAGERAVGCCRLVQVFVKVGGQRVAVGQGRQIQLLLAARNANLAADHLALAQSGLGKRRFDRRHLALRERPAAEQELIAAGYLILKQIRPG